MIIILSLDQFSNSTRSPGLRVYGFIYHVAYTLHTLVEQIWLLNKHMMTSSSTFYTVLFWKTIMKASSAILTLNHVRGGTECRVSSIYECHRDPSIQLLFYTIFEWIFCPHELIVTHVSYSIFSADKRGRIIIMIIIII